MIVTGAVFDEGDQVPALVLSVQAPGDIIKDIADIPDHIDVLHFIASADIIGLALRSVLYDGPDGRAVVSHVQPVAYVLAVAINRQRFPFQRVQDHQWNQLLGELVGAIVVRAVRNRHGQAVGPVIGTHQVVGCCL